MDYLSNVSSTVMFKLFFWILLFGCLSDVCCAQQSNLFCFNSKAPITISTNPNPKHSFISKYSLNYPPKTKDFKRLTYNTCIYFGSSIIAFGVLALFPEDFSSWQKDEIRIPNLFGKWSDNVKTGPVKDNDNFFFNGIAHPYCGAVYYMTARSSGFKSYESFLYSVAMSTIFWEYGVEAFAEVPSQQDLWMTPLMGSIMGEVFFNVKKIIMRHDKRILGSRFLATATLLFLDPFNTVLDGVGYKQNKKDHSHQ